MCDLFLLPAILKICKKYNLSKAIGGVLIAAGVSTTELTATMLSFQRHGVKMIEYGLALVFGGLAFSVLMIPVVAYLVNFGITKPRPDPLLSESYSLQKSRFR
jgi:Ca2+/Na+ antiporter